MKEWSEPRGLRQWGQRAFHLRALLLVSVVSAVIMAELELNWIERVAGAYLVLTNSARPESGAIWEQGRKTETARTTIEKLATDREANQRLARNAASLSEIVSAIGPGQGVMLSAEHFRELYHRLPQGFASEMISPYELLRHVNTGRWSRTYLEKSSDGLLVYLLEPNNHVLHQLKVASPSLALLARRSASVSQSLEDFPVFQNRIYPSERFFQALAGLSEEERRALLPQPERLLEVSGQIASVGISDEAVSGFVEIGFEVRQGSQRRVLLIQGQDWAVWRLRTRLETKGSGSRPAKLPQESPLPQ